MPSSARSGARVIGRYALYDEIASGGMATVHIGRLVGASGFARTVAIKRLHPQFAKDPEFLEMFTDEARLAARIHHPNVVQTFDVVSEEGELFLVMEYVPGESLGAVLRRASARGVTVPLPIASAVMAGVLRGLHAAHRAMSESGEPLHIVHRDVSPQNVLVGADGVARVLDFGVAKAVGRSHATREGQLKGKLAYMAPEQLRGQRVTTESDVWGAAVVLWEVLTGRRLFAGETEAIIFGKVLEEAIPRASACVPNVPNALDDVVRKGLERDPRKRFASAEEMATALEHAERPALPAEVAAWLEQLMGDTLTTRASRVASIESGPFTEEPVTATTAVKSSRPSTLPTEITERSASSARSPRRAVVFGVTAALVAGLAFVGAQRLRGTPATTLPVEVQPSSAKPASPSASMTETAPPQETDAGPTAMPAASAMPTASAAASVERPRSKRVPEPNRSRALAPRKAPAPTPGVPDHI